MKYTHEMFNSIPYDVVSKRIRFCRYFLAAGFLLGIMFCLFYGVVRGMHYPYSTFLFRPWDRFQDFFGVLRMTADRNPYQIKAVVGILGHSSVETSNYFPFTHLLFYPFTLINWNVSLVIYSLLVIGFSVFLTIKVLGSGLPENKNQRFLDVLFFTFMSYPLLFTLDRGNIEGIIFILLSWAAWLYLSGYGKWVAVFIGLAASIKGFPVLFLLFFVKARRWKELIIGITVPICLTLIALLFLQGGAFRNLIILIETFQKFSNFALIKWNGIVHSISLFGIVYSTWCLYNKAFMNIMLLKPIVTGYYVVALIIGLSAVTYVFFSRLDFWKAWFILVAVIQLLPFPSYDYKLIHTLMPLFLFIRTGNETKWTRTYLALFCLIMIPKGFWVLFFDVRCGTIINPLLILAVCLIIVIEQHYGASLSSKSAMLTVDLSKKDRL